MATRTDRIRRYVTAWCPRCHDRDGGSVDGARRLPGYLSEADGRVWLVRGCPDHGRIVTLYDEDPEILDWLERWTAPTKVHVPDTAGNFTPPPAGYLQGLGELQTQHTCILLEDLTDTCNLSCPTCFAGSGPDVAGFVPVEEVLANVDQRLARENGRLDVVMLSGGEPTLHPGFGELLDRLLERDVVRVLVNTNGLTIARGESGVLETLRRHRDRVEVYLQHDGFDLAGHRHHRGADLRRVKAEAVRALSDAGIFTTLTMTIAMGVNDHEIGAVVDLALATPYVTGVSLQPQFGAGRSGEIDALDRLTHTGVLARLGPQTDGRITWRDLTALPCSHPHCCSVGYLFRTDDLARTRGRGSRGPERVVPGGSGGGGAPPEEDDLARTRGRGSRGPERVVPGGSGGGGAPPEEYDLARTRGRGSVDGPVWQSLVALLGPEVLAEHLGLVANTGMAKPELAEDLRVLARESLLGLLSERSSLTHPETAELFRTVCDACDLGVPGLLKLARAGASRRSLRKLLAERIVRITVKPFMDIDTMVEERLLQCCVHVGTRDADANQCAPFCAVQSWTELSGQRLSRLTAGETAPSLGRPGRSLPVVSTGPRR
ncbi:radical SAM protein [Euzebya rosea]|uniref:radical SAM protein n=1 Tax=Euzebya rosea TaxID=2052804 RepID=UPI003B8334E6